ncbi:hypothetical protein ACO0SA_001619 [Hanseniaspora valbyensis]
MEKTLENQNENLVPKQSQKVRTDKPRPHQCSICLRGFVRVEHLKRHSLVHTQERPYDCKQCGRKFGRRDLLIRHIRKLHPATQTIETNFESTDEQPKKKLKKSPPEEILANISLQKEDPFVLHPSEFNLKESNKSSSVNHLTSKNIDEELENQNDAVKHSDSILPIRPPLNKEKSGSEGSIPTRKRVRHSSFSAISSSTYNPSSTNLLGNFASTEDLNRQIDETNYLGNMNYFNLKPTVSNGTSQEKGISEVRFSTPPPIYDVIAHPEKHIVHQQEQTQLENAHPHLLNSNYDLENAFSMGNGINNIIDYNQIVTNLESIFPMKKFNFNNIDNDHDLLDNNNNNNKQEISNEKQILPEKSSNNVAEGVFKRRKSNLNFMNLNLSFNNLSIPFFNSKTPTPKLLSQDKDQHAAVKMEPLASVSEYQKFLGDQAMKNSPFLFNNKSSHFTPGLKENKDYFSVKDDFYPQGYFPEESVSNQLVKNKNTQTETSVEEKQQKETNIPVSKIQQAQEKQNQQFALDHNDPWLNKFIESNFEDKIINDKNLKEFKLHFNDVGFDKHFSEDQKSQSQPHNTPKLQKTDMLNLPQIDVNSTESFMTSSKPTVSSEADSKTPASVRTMSPLEILSNIKSGGLKLSELDDDSLAALYKVRQIDLWKDMLSDVNNSESPKTSSKSAVSLSTDDSGNISDLATTLGKSNLVASKATPELETILDKINTKHPQIDKVRKDLEIKKPTITEVLRAQNSSIKPTNLVWFNEKLRQEIMDHHNLSQFPTCKELNQYANLYKEEFHPYFDFIHLQSIKPSLENHALLSSIAAIGTLYSFHLYHATQLFVITRHTIRKILEDYTENKVHDIPLWVIQTMVNLSFVEMFHNSKEINSKVDIHFHTLIRIIQITELAKPLEKLQNPPIDGRNIQNDENEKKKMFEYFIMAQSRIRTCHIVLLVSNLFSALIGMDCRMHSVDLKEGGVPCSQIELFHCNDHLEWFDILKNRYKITIDSKFSLVELSNGGDSYSHCLSYLCNARPNDNPFNTDSTGSNNNNNNNNNFGFGQGGSIHNSDTNLKMFDSFNRNAPDSLFELENLHSSNLSKFTLMSMLLSIHEKIFIERSKNYSTYQWELKSKPIIINLLDTWKTLFLKNGGVFYDLGTIVEINKSPKLRLILPLYYFAKTRKSINISPILKHIWRKNIDGLNKVLDDLVTSCLSANKTFFEGEDYNRNLLTEATLHCLDTIHLWDETATYKIDNSRDKKANISTPIFFITCISSSIIILSVFLQVIELTYQYGGNLTDFEENVWIQSRRILQSLEKRLNTINVDLNRLNLPSEVITPLESLSIQQLQSWKQDPERKTLKKYVINDKLSLKCLYLGLRILLDAPIWPVCLSFGEVLNERGKYLHSKKESNK